MPDNSFADLIEQARSVLNPVEYTDHRLVGDVAAAVETTDGSVYLGVCIDTPSWGLCAERSAAAAMLTDGKSTISRLVAVWQEHRRGRGNELFVLPPCGHCRQFLLDIDPGNAHALVGLRTDQSVPLRELLPHSTWPEHPIR